MSIFPPQLPADALFLSRENVLDPLAAWSRHGFDLDDAHWPSVEHYFQGMKFQGALREKIRQAGHPAEAAKIARFNFWRVRRDWKRIQRVVMTRAIYIKCRTHPAVAEALLATGDRLLVEGSLYDHYWGCGRDQRGDNHYGKVLMDVRRRLRDEAAPQPS